MTTVGALVMAAGLALGVTGPTAPLDPDLSGVWILEATVGAGLESVIAASETITVEAAAVTIVRGTQPPSTERYVFDDTERPVARVRGQARTCRAAWRDAQLVIACVQPDRGPGGSAPPIVTRESRSIDGTGRLIVERLWRSGTRETTERWTYVRQPQ